MRPKIALLLVFTIVCLFRAPTHAQQPDLNRAGLVVVHGGGRVVSACVAFSEESISGADLLRRSGMGVRLTSYGGLGYGVCAIGSEGCFSTDDCFCQCRSNPCAYWIYSHRQPDGAWSISGVGASAWLVHDGDVDAWVWGDGSAAPPGVSFEQVCPLEAAPAPQPSSPALVPTPAPRTITPLPTPTIPPMPSPSLASPSDTPEPTISPIALTSRPTSQSATSTVDQPVWQATKRATEQPGSLPTSQPTQQPTDLPTALPTADPVSQASTDELEGGIGGYVVFGALVLGLLAWLVAAGTRGRLA